MSDPFDVLGVEARFDLDRKALEDRHRALSGALHPDRYVGRPSAERRIALDRAIDVNAAFRALRDPVKRAEALLSRRGVMIGESAEPKAPPALLMEMMEVREELAEAQQNCDVDKLGALGDRMRLRESAVLERIERAFFESGDAELATLLPTLGELRYLKRFFEELDAIEEQLVA